MITLKYLCEILLIQLIVLDLLEICDSKPSQHGDVDKDSDSDIYDTEMLSSERDESDSENRDEKSTLATYVSEKTPTISLKVSVFGEI